MNSKKKKDVKEDIKIMKFGGRQQENVDFFPQNIETITTSLR